MTLRLLTRVAILALLIGWICQSRSDAAIDPEIIVGVWNFDEGKGDVVKDASENGFDGEISNAKWDTGKFGSALNFAKGNTVTIPVGTGSVKDKISLLMWIQFTDLRAQQNYFSIWDQGDNRFVPYKTDAQELRCWSNTWNVGTGLTVKAKTWYHVANVFDGKTASVYVDGEEKVAQGVPAFQLLDQDQTAWIATDRGTGFLSAVIVDDVGLFNDAIGEDDIKSAMNQGIHTAVFAVSPLDKLPTVWARIKAQD